MAFSDNVEKAKTNSTYQVRKEPYNYSQSWHWYVHALMKDKSNFTRQSKDHSLILCGPFHAFNKFLFHEVPLDSTLPRRPHGASYSGRGNIHLFLSLSAHNGVHSCSNGAIKPILFRLYSLFYSAATLRVTLHEICLEWFSPPLQENCHEFVGHYEHCFAWNGVLILPVHFLARETDGNWSILQVVVSFIKRGKNRDQGRNREESTKSHTCA